MSFLVTLPSIYVIYYIFKWSSIIRRALRHQLESTVLNLPRSQQKSDTDANYFDGIHFLKQENYIIKHDLRYTAKTIQYMVI